MPNEMAEIDVAANQRNSVIDADLSDEGIGQRRLLPSADDFRAEVSGPFPKTIEKGKKRQFFQDGGDIRGKCGLAQEFGQDDRWENGLFVFQSCLYRVHVRALSAGQIFNQRAGIERDHVRSFRRAFKSSENLTLPLSWRSLP